MCTHIHQYVALCTYISDWPLRSMYLRKIGCTVSYKPSVLIISKKGTSTKLLSLEGVFVILHSYVKRINWREISSHLE